MGFPGQSGNPAGRRPGLRPSKNAGDLLVIRVQNERDPKEFLEKVMSGQVVPLQIRAQAAGLLMPFCYARVTDRPISNPLRLPEASTPQQAKANIVMIKACMADGRCGLEEGERLIDAELKFIDAHVLATAQRFMREHPPVLDVTASGGLVRGDFAFRRAHGLPRPGAGPSSANRSKNLAGPNRALSHNVEAKRGVPIAFRTIFL